MQVCRRTGNQDHKVICDMVRYYTNTWSNLKTYQEMGMGSSNIEIIITIASMSGAGYNSWNPHTQKQPSRLDKKGEDEVLAWVQLRYECEHLRKGVPMGEERPKVYITSCLHESRWRQIHVNYARNKWSPPSCHPI